MTAIFDELIGVAYAQFYVFSDGDDAPDPLVAFAGQPNGMCGAQVPGDLFLSTGRHDGKVGMRVELLDGPPPEDGWEDIVEVSFTPVTSEVTLMTWHVREYPLSGLQAGVTYRVRYCGRGMDAANRIIREPQDVEIVDQYLLAFWPAPAEPDRIIRQNSERARRRAQRLPRPDARTLRRVRQRLRPGGRADRRGHRTHSPRGPADRVRGPQGNGPDRRLHPDPPQGRTLPQSLRHHIGRRTRMTPAREHGPPGWRPESSSRAVVHNCLTRDGGRLMRLGLALPHYP